MGEVLGRERPLNYYLQLVRKRVGSRTEALQKRAGSILPLVLMDDFHPTGSQAVLHANGNLPILVTAACSELSAQAMGEGRVEISLQK